MMTGEKPDVSMTGRYSISQTAKALGVHACTVRRWVMSCKIGILDPKSAERIKISGAEILRFWSRH